MRNLFLVLMLVPIISVANEQNDEWVPVSVEDDVVISVKGVRQVNKSEKNVWVEQQFRKEQRSPEKKKFVSQISLNRIDCSKGMAALISYTQYDGKGVVVSSSVIPTNEIVPFYIVPDSRYEKVSKFVCR